MNLIEQNDEGTFFCICYQDNGVYWIKIVGNDGYDFAHLNVSELIGIDESSTPITGFYEPLINCHVMSDGDIFVSVYHRLEKKAYYFTMNKDTQETSEIHSI